MLYTEFCTILLELIMGARTRSRYLRDGRMLDDAAELSALLERLRFFIGPSRQWQLGPDIELVHRINDTFERILANVAFQEFLGPKPAFRQPALQNSRNRPSLDGFLPEGTDFEGAFRLLQLEFARLPQQTTLDLRDDAPARADRLRAIVPEQKIAPAQFEFANDILVVASQEASADSSDLTNISSARELLIEQGERIIQSLEGANVDRKLRENIEELQKILRDGSDIVKLGIMTMTCEHVVSGVADQISDATTGLLTAHTNGLRLYVAQFPDWHRFVGNAEMVEISEYDIEKLVVATSSLAEKLSSVENVDPEVPKVINFVNELVRSPKKTSKKAVFALIRTLENLIAKVYGYLSNFIAEVAVKTSSKVSGAVAVAIAAAVLTSTMGLGGVFKGLPESSWVPSASKIVEQYIMGPAVQ
jgi:hypothetical protein